MTTEFKITGRLAEVGNLDGGNTPGVSIYAGDGRYIEVRNLTEDEARAIAPAYDKMVSISIAVAEAERASPAPAVTGNETLDKQVAEWNKEVARLQDLITYATGAAAPAVVAEGMEDPVSVPRGLLGAACYAIRTQKEATTVLAELRRYTTGDLSGFVPADVPLTVQSSEDEYVLEFSLDTILTGIQHDDEKAEFWRDELDEYIRVSNNVAVRNSKAGSAPLVAQAPGVFPERDTSKAAEQQGIFRKFQVSRVDGSDVYGGKHFGCTYFVLDLDHDAHAPAAMHAYGLSCASTHPELSREILAKYAHPSPDLQAGQDARDAARYRWLTYAGWLDDAIVEEHGIREGISETLDAAIDAAMSGKEAS